MKNNKKGFTLVELVIVVAVMAVLVAVAIPTVSSIVKTAEDAVAESNAKTIESLIKLEYAENVSETGSGAGISTSDIDTALTEGKLGVDGWFLYDHNTGIVTVSEEGAELVANQFLIHCDVEGTAGANAAADETVVVTTVAAGG